MVKKRKFIVLCSLFIFLSGAIFRFVNLNWDQGQMLHPDERFLAMVTHDLAWPQSLKEYFDTSSSPLNPYNQGYPFFVYGTLPLFLNKKIALIFNQNSYNGFNILGRTLAVFADLGTLFLVALIAKKLLAGKNWLWAPFFYSLAVLPIQLAHFFTVDPFLNFFLFLCFWFLIKNYYSPEKKRFLSFAGVALGLALASKITALLFAPVVAIFLFAKNKTHFKKLLTDFSIFFFPFLLTVRLCQPYAFLGFFTPNPQFVQNLLENQRLINTPNFYFPPALQWFGTTPILFPLKNIIFYGLGIPLGAIAFLAVFLIPIRRKKIPPQERLPLFLSWFFVLFLLLVQGSQFNKTIRYFLPIYPHLCLLGGYSLASLIFPKKKSWQILEKIIIVFLVSLWPFSFLRIYLQPHPRIAASEWIYQNVPPGSSLTCEYWDDCLPLPLDSKKNNEALGYKIETLKPFDEESEAKKETREEQLKRADYLILSSNRAWKPISQNKNHYPQTAQFYQDLFGQKLGWQKVAEFTSSPGFPPFGKPWVTFPDQGADEAFTVYDHPQVIIFQKVQ
ncbi:glycosyltransferase family 39 protein [Candidatus Shapirobacteria bacterium]|nr:glycosyltransferase family 39 protein [Candidatus Shapirobacteria bacterium]